jgi:hypothetical protein
MVKKYFTEEERKTVRKKWQKNYRDKNKKKLKEYYQAHAEELKIYNKKYYQNNKEKAKVYENNKLKTDTNFKLARYLRNRIWKAIHNNQKVGSAVQDLGCSIPELKLYLKSKWKDGMTWENWSLTGWHIDHIIPLDSFNLQNKEEFLKACHYKNLQPLWAEENLSKGDKNDYISRTK